MHLYDFRVFWQMASMLQLSSPSAHSSTSKKKRKKRRKEKKEALSLKSETAYAGGT